MGILIPYTGTIIISPNFVERKTQMPELYLGFLMLSSLLRLLVTELDDYWNEVSRGDLMRTYAVAEK